MHSYVLNNPNIHTHAINLIFLWLHTINLLSLWSFYITFQINYKNALKPLQGSLFTCEFFFHFLEYIVNYLFYTKAAFKGFRTRVIASKIINSNTKCFHKSKSWIFRREGFLIIFLRIFFFRLESIKHKHYCSFSAFEFAKSNPA